MAAAGAWVVLTGSPGAGKSTVAGLLADGGDGPTVHLHTDSLYRWIKAGFVEPYLPESARQNQVVFEAVTAAAAAYARGGYDVVLDGIIGPEFAHRYVERAAAEQITMSYVVLTAPLQVVLKRAAARQGEQHLKDPGPIAALHDKFADLGSWTGHAVPTEDRTAAEVAADVARRLRAGEYRAPAQRRRSEDAGLAG